MTAHAGMSPIPVTVEYGPEENYGLYVYSGYALRQLATAPGMADIGVAIGRLHEDEREHGQRFYELGTVGIRDLRRREWIVSPFPRGGAG